MSEEPKPCRKKHITLHAIELGSKRKRNKETPLGSDKYINVCLNCTAPKCRGDCDKIHGGKSS